jgi:hypothetical protein
MPFFELERLARGALAGAATAAAAKEAIMKVVKETILFMQKGQKE